MCYFLHTICCISQVLVRLVKENFFSLTLDEEFGENLLTFLASGSLLKFFDSLKQSPCKIGGLVPLAVVVRLSLDATMGTCELVVGEAE